jgi:hypothetical protein
LIISPLSERSYCAELSTAHGTAARIFEHDRGLSTVGRAASIEGNHQRPSLDESLLQKSRELALTTARSQTFTQGKEISCHPAVAFQQQFCAPLGKTKNN